MKRVEPLKLSLQQIEDATGESLPTIYSAMAAGHLETFLVGRRRFAKPAAVQAWVDFLQRESDAGRPVCYRARSTERRVA